jgi:SWI/SNF-related matrix-associated actin-dependent regulator 1 of chromatin subfamily A
LKEEIEIKHEEDLNQIAKVALANGYFGDQCDLKRVRAELDTYSDFDLHQLCLQFSDYLRHLELPLEALFDSPKMCLLKQLLPRLIVSVNLSHLVVHT